MIGKLAQGLSFVGLSLMIVSAPWAFGGNVAWFQKWLFVVACCTLLPSTLFLLLNRGKPNAQQVPVIAYGLLVALLAGFFQITPLPQAVLKAISPHALEAQRLSATAVGEELPDQLPISLYPTSTANDLALLGLMAVVFVVASTAINDRRYQVAILGIAAANGAAFAVFGLVQQLSFNGMLYWTIPLRFGGRPFAAFVNRNHAGGYLNMCIAASLALIVYALTRRQADYGSGPDDFSLQLARGGPLAGGITGLIANLDAVGLVSMTFAACATIGTVCSVSRGAILALVCAAAITALVAVRARGTVGLATGAIVVLIVCIGMAAWLGKTELLQERWGDTVSDLRSNSNSRIDHWQDVLGVFGDYWITGTGLGTYRFAYRPYETQLSTGWFMHAENQYLEAAVEMGWLGLILIIGSIATVFFFAVRLIHHRGDSLALGIGLAGLYMISSQAVQSGFDFGLYMPANAILCAAIAGLVTAKIPNNDGSETKWSAPASQFSRICQMGLLVILSVWLLWGTVRAFQKSSIESAFDAAYKEAAVTDGEAEEIADTQEALAEVDRNIAKFESAIAKMPGNAEAQFRVAELHIQRYRLMALGELRKTMDSNDELLWQLTLPISFHRRSHELTEQGRQELRKLPLVQSELDPAVEHLLAARRSCPVMHKTHFRLADLYVLLPRAADDDTFDDSTLVQTAVQLAPNDPDVLFRAGLLDWQAGRDAKARAEWRKSLDLSSFHAAPIFEFVATQNMDPAQVVAEIVPAAPSRIVEVARQIKDQGYRTRLAEKAKQALSLAPQTPGLRSHLEASILELNSQIPEAIELYYQAGKENPNNISWWHKLSLLLLREKRFDEASRCAAECIKLAPGDQRYRQLLRRIRLESRQHDAN